MKSLNEVLEGNRKQAVKMMLDNNVNHISFTDYEGDISVPNILLINKNGEPYETDVTDVKIVNNELFIKVINTSDLSSSEFIDEEGYISHHGCAYYTANDVYYGIEDYFENELYLENNLKKISKEIKQKFINLLTNEDEKSFTFSKYDCFNIFASIKKTSIKSIYIEGSTVYVETKEDTAKVPLCVIGLEKRLQLLRHLKDCLRS